MTVSAEDVDSALIYLKEGLDVILAEMAKWHAEQEALRHVIKSHTDMLVEIYKSHGAILAKLENLERKYDETLEWMAESLE